MLPQLACCRLGLQAGQIPSQKSATYGLAGDKARRSVESFYELFGYSSVSCVSSGFNELSHDELDILLVALVPIAEPNFILPVPFPPPVSGEVDGFFVHLDVVTERKVGDKHK